MVKPYVIHWSSRVKKDYKKMRRQGKDMTKLDAVITLIATRADLPDALHDHPLTSNWANHRECHIESDWLLVYHIYENNLVLELTRTGSHSDLFG